MIDSMAVSHSSLSQWMGITNPAKVYSPWDEGRNEERKISPWNAIEFPNIQEQEEEELPRRLAADFPGVT